MEGKLNERIGFEGRVAIVTGAGNGLGREYALELARRGAKVVVNDLGGTGSGQGASGAPADLVVAEIREAGGEAVASYHSVATRAGGAAIVEAALDNFGAVDICINNAGFLRNARFEDLTDDQIDAIIDVHLKGAFYVAQPAYRAMRRGGYGRLLFTGSASAMFGHAWQANYASAKGGLMGLSHVVAIEGSAFGITSNLLMPTAASRLAAEMDKGFMEIPAFAKAVADMDRAAAAGGRTDPAYNMPLALYLVSEGCQHTHGIFTQNSGRYAQVRIAACDGWVAPQADAPPTLEEIAAHWGEICDPTITHEPHTVYEEFTAASAAARRQGVI